MAVYMNKVKNCVTPR